MTSLADYLLQSADMVQQAAASVSKEAMDKAVAACVHAVKHGQPILVCGNGGSAADALHISAELTGRFAKERKGLNCICLSANPAMLTAWSNDYDYASVFARQVESHGSKGAVLVAISTSGNSPNVVQALEKAKELGLATIGLTGHGGGKMAPLCDALLDAPGESTALIQQVHICLYHYLCGKIEAAFA